MGIALMVVGAALMIGPNFVAGMPDVLRFGGGILGLILFLMGLGITVITSLWKKTSADEAFVVTGGAGGSKVVLDSGTLVIPLLHNVVPVNLKTMKLGGNPHGANALITHDNLRSDILAQFYIRV